MKIAICDSSNAFLKAFRTELINYGEASDLWLFDNYKEMLENKCCHELECVFLATEINGSSGINVALELKKLNRDVEIVFITENCEKYAQQIFCYADTMRPFSLLVKPVSRSFMRHTLDMLKNIVVYRNSVVFNIRLIDGQIVSIVSEDTIYVEHNNRISTVVTTKGTVETRNLISFFDEKLPQPQFIHAAKSLIVNSKFVDMIRHNRILLKNGTELFSSRNYRSPFEKSYLEYINTISEKEPLFI